MHEVRVALDGDGELSLYAAWQELRGFAGKDPEVRALRFGYWRGSRQPCLRIQSESPDVARWYARRALELCWTLLDREDSYPGAATGTAGTRLPGR